MVEVIRTNMGATLKFDEEDLEDLRFIELPKDTKGLVLWKGRKNDIGPAVMIFHELPKIGNAHYMLEIRRLVAEEHYAKYSNPKK